MNNLKKLLPYLLVFLGFIILSYAYTPEVLKGKVVNQSDISSFVGMSHEIVSYNEEHPDDETLWTNSMFSGMPATAISVNHKGDYTQPVFDVLFTGARPASYLLISLIGGFLLFLAFGTNIYLAALGAIAITFCSYNMQIIQVGHNTKMVAIAFMPWVLAAVVYAYRRKSLVGALLFAFALSFQIKANHPQITYYLAIIIFGYAIAELCNAIRNKQFPKFLKTSALLLVAGLLGIATNSNRLLPTYEYQKYTMRGGSELSDNKDLQTGDGLKLDYATAWSYGIGETPNLMIPNFNGGSSAGALGRDSETYKVLKSKYQGADQIIKQLPLYWGPQPFTAGPMYMGAISIFLFVLGIALIKGSYKWWIVGVSLVALLLAWGSHFMWFSELFFKYAPLYNKFRTVSMILVVLQITIPVLGVLAVNEVLNDKQLTKERAKKGFLTALGVTCGFSLLFILFPSLAGSFVSSADGSLPADISNALVQDRMALLRSDAFRSLIYIILGAVVLWLGYIRKLKTIPSICLLAALILIDLWTVDKRYLNDSHFLRKTEFNNQFAKRPVDNMILEDKDPYYRVLDLSINTFNDAHVSYHHKTIGGYSPVKLQRYQDLIDYYIAPEMEILSKDVNASLSTAKTIGDIEGVLGYYPVLSMLNTKYIVLNGDNPPVQYKYPLGNAWVVNNVVWAANPDEEIGLIASIDPAKSVIFSDKDEAALAAKQTIDKMVATDTTSSVQLTDYAPNRLKYISSSTNDAVAVFSEIYYPKGWYATIDGQAVDILRANYALRALVLPAGEHEIEFYFSPKSFEVGDNISRISSGLLFLALILVVGFSVIRQKIV